MSFSSLLGLSGGIALGLMTLLWLVSLALKNSSIVDIFWGIGFLLVAWTACALSQEGYLPRKYLVCTITSLWGLRLALHIGGRNWGKPEDFRYAAWRAQHGSEWWWISLFKVFLLQGFIMWIISAPIVAALVPGFPATLTPPDVIGGCIAAIGLLWETVADAQLASFKRKASNKGKLLTGGLWKYSRHPNYFGESVVWWGVFLIAWAAGAWWAIVSPILMTWLLLRVSGVALIEQTMRSKPGYEDYMRYTSAFVPWFQIKP